MYCRIPEKIPMNLLPKQNGINNSSTAENKEINSVLNLDLNYLVQKSTESETTPKIKDEHNDDVLVDITDEKMLGNDSITDTTIAQKPETVPVTVEVNSELKAAKNELKLSDIFVTLESIKPSTVTPLVVVDEKNGISVTLHFAKDKPREDVSVIVITTVSKNEQPLNSYLFQAVVPKVLT